MSKTVTLATEAATLSNAQRDAAIPAIKAGEAVTKANATLAVRAHKLMLAGITPADISRGGKLLAAFQKLTAETILTAAQLKTWGDASLAAKPRDASGKQVNSERGKLIDRVNSCVRNVRAAMADAEAADAPEGKGGGKGAGASKSAPHAVDLNKVAEVRKRIVTLAASDKPADKEKVAAYGDAKAIIAALDTAIAAFAKK